MLFANYLSAQTEQGNFMVSGASGLIFTSSNIESEYDGSSQGDVDNNTFSLTPSLSYFVIDNLAIGLATTYTSSTQKDEGEKYTVSSTIIMPAAVYYFPIESEFRPFLQAGAGYSSSQQKYSFIGDSEKEKFGGLALNIGGGASYFINTNISANFGLAYTQAKLSNNNDSDLKLDQSSFAGNIGFSFFF